MLVNNNAAKLGIVLGNFDFVKTQALMEELGWNWASPDTFKEEIPAISTMVDLAHRLLIRAVSETGFCASGGFEATFYKGVFTLKFVTEESSNEDTFAYTLDPETVKDI